MQKLVLTTFLLFVSFVPFTVADPLLLAVYGVEESSDSFQISQSLVSEIALRCDVNITLVATPSHRINDLLRSAEIDGSLSVANKFTDNIPGIITVPEPVARLPIVGYAKNPDLKINGWSGLKNHKVAYNSSLVIVKSKLNDIKANAIAFSSDIAALKFVASGRADLFISFPFSVELLLKSKEFNASGIKALLPPYEVYAVYMHLLPRHKGREECFAVALKNMNEDKIYGRIMNGEFLEH